MKKLMFILLIALTSCEKDLPEPIQNNPTRITSTPTPTQPPPITQISPFFVGVRLIVVLNRHPTKAISAVYIDNILQNFDYPIIGNRGYQSRNRSRINVGSEIRIIFSGPGNFNYFNLWRFDSYNNVVRNNPIRLNVARDSTIARYQNREALNSITTQDQFSIIAN